MFTFIKKLNRMAEEKRQAKKRKVFVISTITAVFASVITSFYTLFFSKKENREKTASWIKKSSQTVSKKAQELGEEAQKEMTMVEKKVKEVEKSVKDFIAERTKKSDAEVEKKVEEEIKEESEEKSKSTSK